MGTATTGWTVGSENELLEGGDKSDTLIGGLGDDTMSGGAESDVYFSDTFVYRFDLSTAGVKGTGNDHVLDFKTGQFYGDTLVLYAANGAAPTLEALSELVKVEAFDDGTRIVFNCEGDQEKIPPVDECCEPYVPGYTIGAPEAWDDAIYLHGITGDFKDLLDLVASGKVNIVVTDDPAYAAPVEDCCNVDAEIADHPFDGDYAAKTLAGLADPVQWYEKEIPTNEACYPRDKCDEPEDPRDLWEGTKGNDTIVADGGNDTIYGRSGDDLLAGGDGNDSVFGEANADTIQGNAGNDTLDGGTGNDRAATRVRTR